MIAIARNVSVPFGAPYKSFGVYNTEYRTVSDPTSKLYFFELRSLGDRFPKPTLSKLAIPSTGPLAGGRPERAVLTRDKGGLISCS
jgi:choloylglycine hydrolase